MSSYVARQYTTSIPRIWETGTAITRRAISHRTKASSELATWRSFYTSTQPTRTRCVIARLSASNISNNAGIATEPGGEIWDSAQNPNNARGELIERPIRQYRVCPSTHLSRAKSPWQKCCRQRNRPSALFSEPPCQTLSNHKISFRLTIYFGGGIVTRGRR